MSVEHARRCDTCVLVGDDGQVINRLALDVLADLEQFRDAMAAPVVDKDLARAHFHEVVILLS